MAKQIGVIVLLLGMLMVHTSCQTYESFNAGVFNEVNHARHDPGRFAHYLDYDLDNRFPDDETSREVCLDNDMGDNDDITECQYRVETLGGREWYEAAIHDLRHGTHRDRVDRLNWSGALTQQCYDIISQQGPAGHYGHIGEDGSTLRDRVDRYADDWTAVSEIMVYSDRYGNIGQDMVKQLLLDDGIETLSHRSTILNEDWTHLGVSCGCHSVYSLTCCIAFGIEVDTQEEYERPLVGDVVNSCECDVDTFGTSAYEDTHDDDTTHIGDDRISLFSGTYRRGELSEVSYDSAPAEAISIYDAEDDFLGNSTLTYFMTHGRHDHNDQPNPETCPNINPNTTSTALGNSDVPQASRLQIRQNTESVTDGLTISEIGRQANQHNSALTDAEQTLGENIGNTTDTDDAGYTGVPVPSSYENRAREIIIEELNNIRDDPQGYATENYSEEDPEYAILMSHTSCDSLDWNDYLADSALSYVNEAGPCGTDNTGNTPDGYSLVDYFLVNFDEWGYTSFGMLYGSYYLQNPTNVVSAIITQMGEEYLFNCYYDQIGIGCACSSTDTFTCAYIMSSELTENESDIQAEWMPLYSQENCSLLCSNSDDSE